MPLLLFLFILVPLLEMVVLIKVGEVIGALNTVGLVLLTAVIGLWLLRREGFATLLRARQRLDAGEVPAGEMLEGMVIAAGGALLLTPGFITDTIGFCCLIPPVRRALVRLFYRRWERHIIVSHRAGESGDVGDRVIEGEYRREK